MTSSPEWEPVTIGSTVLGRIAIVLPTLLLLPFTVVGLVGIFFSGVPIGVRIAFFLMGLTFGALTVWAVREAARADVLTLIVAIDQLEVRIGGSSFTHPRSSTSRILLRVSRAGVMQIAPVADGQRPAYLMTGWRWRQAGAVQKLLATHGWPSAITSINFGSREWHRVEPKPVGEASDGYRS